MTRKLKPGTHNVKIKGKLRKVRVLASGQWRFMKGKVRKTIKKVTKKKTYKKKTTKSKPVKRVGRFSTQTIFKWLRIAALVGPGVAEGLNPANKTGYLKAVAILNRYTGYNFHTRRFDWGYLVSGWLPFLATTLVTYGVQKLAGILRRF